MRSPLSADAKQVGRYVEIGKAYYDPYGPLARQTREEAVKELKQSISKPLTDEFQALLDGYKITQPITSWFFRLAAKVFPLKVHLIGELPDSNS